MKKTCLGLLMLALWGCSGATTNSDGTSSAELEKKRAAANEVAKGTAEGDACAENGWYGDGECDTFCDGADTDCVPNGKDPTFCAAFSEAPDGVCGRPEDDVCRYQDPDCSQSGGGPANPGNPDEPVGCALILELSDGVCLRPASDPCREQDPDCSQVEPDPGVGCPAIALAPDGVCSPPVGEEPCVLVDPDCDVACAEYIEDSDGVCKRADTDPCRSQDPDCDVACLTYVEEPDGECTRPSTDPCRSQDPDCKAP